MKLFFALIAAVLGNKSFNSLTEQDKRRAVRLSQSFAPKK